MSVGQRGQMDWLLLHRRVEWTGDSGTDRTNGPVIMGQRLVEKKTESRFT